MGGQLLNCFAPSEKLQILYKSKFFPEKLALYGAKWPQNEQKHHNSEEKCPANCFIHKNCKLHCGGGRQVLNYFENQNNLFLSPFS